MPKKCIPSVIINYYLIIYVLFLLHFNFNIYLFIYFFIWTLDILPSPSTCNPLPRRSTKRQTREKRAKFKITADTLMKFPANFFTEERDGQGNYNVIHSEVNFFIHGPRKLACHPRHAATTQLQKIRV